MIGRSAQSANCPATSRLTSEGSTSISSGLILGLDLGAAQAPKHALWKPEVKVGKPGGSARR